jgi:CBS domain-containing protein
MQEDVPQPDSLIRWRVMVDPVASLEPASIKLQTVSAGTSLAEAVRQMQDRNVGYLLITDTDDKLVGILTEHDLMRRIACRIPDLTRHTVDEFMTPDPTVVSPDDPIKHALFHMAVNDFMYVPVVDEQHRPRDLVSFRRLCAVIEQLE